MFPHFTSTAANITRASSLMLKVGSDAHLYDDPHDADIPRLLDSKFDAETIEGMKRLMALMSQGCDVSNFFPQVVKNVASPSLEVKKLVYIYLVHYAEKRPDEALLSINTFQKELSDLNPLVRAWALRAMSGIRVSVVAPLMLMAVHKCARDPSPYVRRCATNAIPKLYALDRDHHHVALEELVGILLDDISAGVVGAAAAAFSFVCPEQLSMVATRFRKLCEKLPDVEEWGQIVLVDILLRYIVARYGIPKAHATGCSSQGQLMHGQKEKRVKGGLDLSTEVDIQCAGGDDSTLSMKFKAVDWFESLEDEDKRDSSGLSGDGRHKSNDNDDEVVEDVRLLLQCTSPLLWSHNSAVVLAAVGAHWILAPKEETKRIVKPLLFLLRSSFDSQYVVLTNLVTFVQARPSLFEAYYEDFFVRSSDTQQIRIMKLDILALIATESSIHAILQEFQAYVRDPDRGFAANTVKAIGMCAKRLPSVAFVCMEGLLSLAKGSSSHVHKGDEAKTEEVKIVKESLQGQVLGKGILGEWYSSSSELKDREAVVVTQAVLAIRAIVQQHFEESEKIFARLVRSLDQIKVQGARAVVIWMIGEYCCKSILVDMLPTLIQYFGATFLREDVDTKLQILNCVSKVVLQSQQAFDLAAVKSAILAMKYLLDLGDCDVNYDVRDRARMLGQLLAMHLKAFSPNGTELSVNSVDATSSNKQSELITSSNSEILSSTTIVTEAKSVMSILSDSILLSPKLTPPLPSVSPDRNFLPGSMSHVVRHTAPGYRPLPEPFSIEEQEKLGFDDALNFGNSLSDRKKSSFSEAELDEESDSFSGSSRTYSGEGSDGRGSYNRGGNGMMHSTASESDDSSSDAADKLKFQKAEVHTRPSRSRSSEVSNQLGKPVRDIEQRLKSSIGKEVEVGPLISLSDTEILGLNEASSANIECREPEQVHSDGLQLRSIEDLEFWLGPSKAQNMESGVVSSHKLGIPTGYATLSVGSLNAEPKKVTLLDFTNGGGLEVKYCYLFTASIYSQNMVCVRLFFHNRSSEVLSGITVKSFDSGGASSELPSSTMEDIMKPLTGKGVDAVVVVPLQEISTLDPDQTTEANLHVDFHHHLMPVKLAVYCNQKCFPVKLAPDVGALLRPMAMTAEGFTSAESRLSGMLESERRCCLRRPVTDSSLKGPVRNHTALEEDEEMLSIARMVASRVLQSANVSLVSVTIPIYPGVSGNSNGLCTVRLRFSGETLRESMLCLITVTIDVDENIGNCENVPALLKVNCEDSIFGLNLLKRLDNALDATD